MSEQSHIRAEDAAELIAIAIERGGGEPRLDASTEAHLDAWRSTLPTPPSEPVASKLCGH